MLTILRCLALLLLLPCAALAAQPLKPLTAQEAFGSPRYAEPRLSPDGRFLALLAAEGGRMNLAVLDLETGKFESKIAVPGADISAVQWVGNERLVFSLAQYGQSRKSLVHQGGLFMSSRDGKVQRKLYQTAADWVAGSGGRRYTRMWAQQTIPGSTDELIVASDDVDKDSIDLYRLHVMTGKRSWISPKRPPRVQRWVLDAALQARVAIASEAKSLGVVVHYREPTGEWRELWHSGGSQGDIKLPISVEPDGKLIVASNEGRDTVALREYDPATDQWGETLVEHPLYDVAIDALGEELAPVVHDSRTQELVGVRIEAGRPVHSWLDPRLQAVQAMVDSALPGRINSLQFSGSKRVFVASRGDAGQATWYLLDRSSGQLSKLLDTRPELDPQRMPITDVLTLRSRDDLALLSTRLRPPQAPAGAALPTIVLVHGGPWVRGAMWGDGGGGDMAMARWLASRGYQVLLPSFRGSVGFGKRFVHASRGQFGLAMQDDLDEAMDALIRRGEADPARLCIMGDSYGGYASLMAVARTPERYRCAVSGFPVTDLPTLLTSDWSDLSRDKDKREFWIDMVGDPIAQREALRAASPVHLASRIRAAVMIYAGVDDRRTPLEQAEGMRKALERAGHKPLWLAKYGEGHGYSLTSNHNEMLTMLEPFLAEQLKP